MSAPENITGTARQETTAVASVAKDEAGAVAGTAKQAAADVAGTAKGQAAAVASDTAQQARQLASQTKDQVTQQADTQAEKLVAMLRSLADEFTTMGQSAEQGGVAGKIVTEVAQRARTAADRVEQRGPQGLLADLTSLARRKPGGFLLGSLLAGVATGRLSKGLTAGASSSGQSYPTDSTPVRYETTRPVPYEASIPVSTTASYPPADPGPLLGTGGGGTAAVGSAAPYGVVDTGTTTGAATPLAGDEPFTVPTRTDRGGV